MAKITEFLKFKVAQMLRWMLVMCGPPQPRRLHVPEHWPCNAHVGVTGVLCTPGTHTRVAGRFVRLTRVKSPPPPLPSFSSYSYPWSSSSSGDLIGSESGVHITGGDIFPLAATEEKKAVAKCHGEMRMHVAKKRDIPPCISILPEYIGILPTIFEDHELANGDYFEAIRKNGSLNLNCVTVFKWFEGKLGDDDDDEDENHEIEEEPTFIMD